MKNHPVQCFYGKQTKHYDIEKSEETQEQDGFVKYDKIVSHNGSNIISSSDGTKPA